MSDVVHSPEVQHALDENHLKLLQIFHIIQGVLKLVGTLFVVVYFGLFSFLFSNPHFMESSSKGYNHSSTETAEIAHTRGGFFLIFGIIITIFMVAMTALSFFQAHCFAKRRHSLLCLILAGLDCLSLPYGTILGIFTFMVLFRPSVKALFDEAQQLNQLGQ